MCPPIDNIVSLPPQPCSKCRQFIKTRCRDQRVFLGCIAPRHTTNSVHRNYVSSHAGDRLSCCCGYSSNDGGTHGNSDTARDDSNDAAAGSRSGYPRSPVVPVGSMSLPVAALAVAVPARTPTAPGHPQQVSSSFPPPQIAFFRACHHLTTTILAREFRQPTLFPLRQRRAGLLTLL